MRHSVFFQTRDDPSIAFYVVPVPGLKRDRRTDRPKPRTTAVSGEIGDLGGPNPSRYGGTATLAKVETCHTFGVDISDNNSTSGAFRRKRT